jgi:L,D-transpeptidase ErfK/SrfK
MTFVHALPLALLAAIVSAPAAATTFELDETTPQVFGEITHYTTTYEDTFTDIARRYSLGWEEVIRVNPGIDPWVPGAGKDLVLPTRRILPSGPHEGIVINLPEHRLYYFPKPKKGQKPIVITYAVSIGKMDWHTPLGETRILSKQKNPSWYPPESVRKEHAERGEPLPAVVKPGPDNPLGAYAMRLAITPGAYLIHGTNNPLAVGMAVTHGCMRMYPEDIEALFPIVPVGTKVRIVNEPVKVAFVNGELLLEVHPPVDAEGQTIEPDLEMFSKLLDQALGPTTAAVHWGFARETMQLANGLPTVVGLEADVNPTPETQVADADGTVMPPAEGQPGETLPPSSAASAPQPGTGIAPATGTPAASPTAGQSPGAPTIAAQSSGASTIAGQSPGASTVVASSPQAPAPAAQPSVRARPATPATLQPPPEKLLPAPPMPAADPTAAPSSGGTRTFPAGDPALSTAHPATSDAIQPSQPSSAGTAVATAPDHP